MSVRAREILLRWGEFSNEYIKEARFVKQENEESGWMWWSLLKIVGLSIMGPIVAILPFVLNVTDDCVESLIGHSVWMGRRCFGVRVEDFLILFFSLRTRLKSTNSINKLYRISLI